MAAGALPITPPRQVVGMQYVLSHVSIGCQSIIQGSIALEVPVKAGSLTLSLRIIGMTPPSIWIIKIKTSLFLFQTCRIRGGGFAASVDSGTIRASLFSHQVSHPHQSCEIALVS